MKTMTMGIPFVFPGLHAAEVATIPSPPISAGVQPWPLRCLGTDPVRRMLLLLLSWMKNC